MVFSGTPYYMAPELYQFKNARKSDPVQYSRMKQDWFQKIDLYAFGVMCCEIVLGETIPIFTSQEADEYRANTPYFMHRINQSNLSSHQKEVLNSLLNSNPAMRPSIDEVVNAFS